MRRVRLITLRFPFSPTEGSSYGLAQKGRVSAHMGLGQRKGTGKRERDWVSAKGRESAKGTGSAQRDGKARKGLGLAQKGKGLAHMHLLVGSWHRT